MENLNLIFNLIKASNIKSILVRCWWDLSWERDSFDIVMIDQQENQNHLPFIEIEKFLEKICDEFLETSFVENSIYENSISDYDSPRGYAEIHFTNEQRIIFSFKEDYISEDYQENEREVDDPELYDLLTKLGLNGISADYNGYGDSGEIENFSPDIFDIPTVDFNFIEDRFYMYLENFNSGWEINEGSRGSLSFEQANDTSIILVTNEHTWYVEQNDYSIRNMDVTEVFHDKLD